MRKEILKYLHERLDDESKHNNFGLEYLPKGKYGEMHLYLYIIISIDVQMQS